MRRREDPLTKRERAELVGYVSRSTGWLRAVLFALVLAAVAGLAFKFQRSLSIDHPVWVGPTALVGLTLYWRSRRWTGGRDLRARITVSPVSSASLVKPPLSMATVRELGIGHVRWKILPVAFEDLRRVA